MDNELYDFMTSGLYLDFVENFFDYDFKEILCNEENMIVYVGFHEFAAVKDEDLLTTISTFIKSPDDSISINTVAEGESKSIVCALSANRNVSMSDIDEVMQELKDILDDKSNAFIGFYINDDLVDGIRIQGVVTGNKNKIKLPSWLRTKLDELDIDDDEDEDDDFDELDIDDSNVEAILDFKLIFDIAVYFLNNPVSVLGIQEKFGLGFNRALLMLDTLENYGIISHKDGMGKRKMLCKNEEEIRRKIDD